MSDPRLEQIAKDVVTKWAGTLDKWEGQYPSNKEELTTLILAALESAQEGPQKISRAGYLDAMKTGIDLNKVYPQGWFVEPDVEATGRAETPQHESDKNWLRSQRDVAEERLKELRAKVAGLLDAKYLNPDCSINGCQYLKAGAEGRDKSAARIKELEFDAGLRKDEIAKLTSEVLHERDKVEEMARRADRFLARAEAAESELAALRAEGHPPEGVETIMADQSSEVLWWKHRAEAAQEQLAQLTAEGRPEATGRAETPESEPTMDYARWATIAERPEHRLLLLADIGARESHYVFARTYPEKYPGHSGGTMTCGHADCRAVQAAIREAIDEHTTAPKLKPPSPEAIAAEHVVYLEAKVTDLQMQIGNIRALLEATGYPQYLNTRQWVAFHEALTRIVE